MTPPLYLDYIPVSIMKHIEFENIYNIFCPITYIMCKYNREENTNIPVVKKNLTYGVCTASGETAATRKLRHNIHQNR